MDREHVRGLLLSDAAVDALARHLQSEWAGPYMAHISDFTEEQVKAGWLREADRAAEATARDEARRAIEAALAAVRL